MSLKTDTAVFSTPSCIALAAGLAPHAEPFSLDTLSGPESLLGDCGTAFFTAAPFTLGTLPEGTKHFAGEGLSLPAPTYLAGAVNSTFSVAWKLVEDGMLPPWGAVLAQRQNAGRGQMRRAWHSPPGNLYVSFRLPDDPFFFSGPASLLVGYLLVSAFHDMGFPLMLKWPNDLLSAAQAKVGGILLEERGGVLLAGLGINILHRPEAGSLRKDSATPAGVLVSASTLEKNPVPAPFFLWQDLVGRVILAYEQKVAQRSFSELIPRLEPHLAWKGQQVVLSDTDGTRITGRYETLSSGGGLVLRMPDGQMRELYSGSLSRP